MIRNDCATAISLGDCHEAICDLRYRFAPSSGGLLTELS